MAFCSPFFSHVQALQILLITCLSLGIKPHCPIWSVTHPWAFSSNVNSSQSGPLNPEQSLPLLGLAGLVLLIVLVPPGLGPLYLEES